MNDRVPPRFIMPRAWNEDGTPAFDAPAAQPLPAEAPARTMEDIVDAEVVELPPVGAGSSRHATYVVPQRFGMSAILGIMTALAVMFGILQSLNAHAFIYLFLGVLSLVICVVQMFFGGVPRVASAAAGAVVFAIFALCLPLVSHRVPLGVVFVLFVMSLPLGGFLGYLTGTCAAGIFLIMDQLERFLQVRRGVELATTATSASP